MLGKNNFKEKLRQMEEQNKKERFSVRKLSVGAVSVLIGFAFMRFGAQSAQADTVTPGSNPVTAEVKNAGDNSTNKTDQPQAEVSADITAKDEQVNPIVKNDESSLTAKISNENEDSASKLATDKSKDVVTSTEENHTRSTTEQVAKTEAGNGAVANSQAKADEAAKDLTETAAGQVAQDTAKADRKGTVNDENVINAANDLEKQIMDQENPSNGHNLTSAQLQQINKVLLKRQVLLDRYHAAQAEERASQTFDPSQFAGISGDLSSIITMLPVVPGNGGFDSTQWGTMNVECGELDDNGG